MAKYLPVTAVRSYLAALTLAIPSLALADTSYTGPSGGNWGDALNWNNGVPSSAGGWAEVKHGGTVVIDSTTTATSASLYLGNDSTVNQTGGTYTTSGGFEFGIGDDSSGKSGTYNISGGVLSIGNSFLIVGNSPGATGNLNVTGTGVVNTNTSGLILGRDATNSVGHLTVGGGGQVNANSISTFGGVGSGGTGTILLNTGGTLTVNQNIGQNNGSLTLTFDGGTLKAGGSDGNFVQSGMTVVLGANGGIVDTNGFDTGIQSAVTGAGSLTKVGGDQLKLGGAISTYTGNTIVNAGVFTVEESGGLTFDINASGVNNKLTGNGTGNLNLFGSFTFDLSGAAATGSWTIVDTAGFSGAANYGANFSVTGFTQTSAGVWQSGNYTFDQSSGVLSAVPEPSTWVMITCGLAGLMVFRRRLGRA